MNRLLPHPALSAMLLIVWLLMANSITVGGIVLGGVFALILPKFTQPFWPDRPRMRFGRALVGYLVIVLFDILVANFQVAWLILFRRNRDLRARWLVIPIDLTTPEAITMLAGTISLTPGTVSSDVSADGRFLLVHALDVDDEAAEIAHRPVGRVDAAVVRDVVAPVTERAGVERGDPEAVHSQPLEVVEPADDTLEVAGARAGGVGEGTDEDLVEDGGLVPLRVVP